MKYEYIVKNCLQYINCLELPTINYIASNVIKICFKVDVKFYIAWLYKRRPMVATQFKRIFFKLAEVKRDAITSVTKIAVTAAFPTSKHLKQTIF